MSGKFQRFLLSQSKRTDQINIIFQDINRVEASLKAWGQQFTYDCNKQKRSTHSKWFDRNVKHVERVADKIRNQIGC